MSDNKRNQTRKPLPGKTTGKPKQSSKVDLARMIRQHSMVGSLMNMPGSSKALMRSVMGITDPNKVYTVRQSAFLLYTTSATTNTFFALAPTLGSFSNQTVFQSLFDQYKLRKLTFEFIPQQNAVVVNTTALTAYPYLIVAGDYDDSTNWSSISQALSYENAKIHATYQHFTYDVIPHVVITAAGGGAVNVGNEWVDTATPNQPWFGLKGVLTAGAAAANSNGYNIFVHADLEFRNVI